MADRNFTALLQEKWREGKSICVGLDSDPAKIPDHITGNINDRIFTFNKAIIDATHHLVVAYKPNSAFYEASGLLGLEGLRRTIQYANNVAPDIPVILDCKRGDIDNTNLGYTDFAFAYNRADAITVHPTLGSEAMKPFLDQKDKGIVVLCRTSNKGAGEFQDLEVQIDKKEFDELSSLNVRCWLRAKEYYTTLLFLHVAYQVSRFWNQNNNCALVVGATYPKELAEVRRIVGKMPILIPGVGFQQKDVPLIDQMRAVVEAGQDSDGDGIIINNSRGVIFKSNGTDFDEAAATELQKLDNLSRQFRITQITIPKV